MFSVIIPIYNEEIYLKDAIDSVMFQTEQSWELLLINDGSTDSTSEVCQKYATIDKRIKVFEKENSGVSDSRNLGLEAALGEWIIFLDADDWLEVSFLSEFKKSIMEFTFDLYICNYFVAFNEKQRKCMPRITATKIEHFKYNEMADMMLRQSDERIKEQYGYLRTVWAKCFKKEHIRKNKLTFCPELKIGEDRIFLLEYMKCIKNICFIQHPLYNYRDNPFSVTHSRKWIDNSQGKLYFLKAEEIVGDIVEETAKAALWFETAKTDWNRLTVSDIGIIQKLKIYRELMQDELYIRFSKKNSYTYLGTKKNIYMFLIRNRAALFMMILNYYSINKMKAKAWLTKSLFTLKGNDQL